VRVEGQLTIQDFLAFRKAMYKRAKNLPRRDSNPWKRRFILAICWLAIFFGVAAIRYSEGTILPHVPFALFLALAFSGSYIYFLRDADRRLYPDESGTTLGAKSYELTNIGVVVVSPHVEATTQWSGVTAVEETPTHLFLFVDRCGGFIIPKRFFNAASQAAEFRNFAQGHVRSAA
jgi:hypothetical protein